MVIDQAYAHPVCEPPEVTLNEHGEPALPQPDLTIVGSGALSGSVVDAVTAYGKHPVPTAEAATVVVSRTFEPSVLNTLRGSEKLGMLPSVAVPVVCCSALPAAPTSSQRYVTEVVRPAGRSAAS